MRSKGSFGNWTQNVTGGSQQADVAQLKEERLWQQRSRLLRVVPRQKETYQELEHLPGRLELHREGIIFQQHQYYTPELS